MGVGPAMVRKRLELLAAAVDVTSHPHEGSVFALRTPLHPAPPACAGAAEPTA